MVGCRNYFQPGRRCPSQAEVEKLALRGAVDDPDRVDELTAAKGLLEDDSGGVDADRRSTGRARCRYRGRASHERQAGKNPADKAPEPPVAHSHPGWPRRVGLTTSKLMKSQTIVPGDDRARRRSRQKGPGRPPFAGPAWRLASAQRT